MKKLRAFFVLCTYDKDRSKFNPRTNETAHRYIRTPQYVDLPEETTLDHAKKVVLEAHGAAPTDAFNHHLAPPSRFAEFSGCQLIEIPDTASAT